MDANGVLSASYDAAQRALRVTGDFAATDHNHDGTYAALNMLPWTVQIDPTRSSPKSQTSWNSYATDANAIGNGYNNASAQNAALVYDVVLAAGTWTVDFMSFTGPNYGIATVQLDDGAGSFTTLGTVDLYAVGVSRNVISSIAGSVVASTTRRQLRFLMATKNASSGGYGCPLQFISLRRTA